MGHEQRGHEQRKSFDLMAVAEGGPLTRSLSDLRGKALDKSKFDIFNKAEPETPPPRRMSSGKKWTPPAATKQGDSYSQIPKPTSPALKPTGSTLTPELKSSTPAEKPPPVNSALSNDNVISQEEPVSPVSDNPFLRKDKSRLSGADPEDSRSKPDAKTTPERRDSVNLSEIKARLSAEMAEAASHPAAKAAAAETKAVMVPKRESVTLSDNPFVQKDRASLRRDSEPTEVQADVGKVGTESPQQDEKKIVAEKPEEVKVAIVEETGLQGRRPLTPESSPKSASANVDVFAGDTEQKSAVAAPPASSAPPVSSAPSAPPPNAGGCCIIA